jgi:predicted branched-subunit amino acid permease
MSLSVSQKVDDEFSIGKRLIASFGITDEVFAVSTQRKGKLSFSYMLGLISTPILGWTVGTLLGAALTSLLPEALSDAMGIALYGMFIAIIVPPARDHKNILFAVLLAIAASYGFTYLPGLNKISGGWTVILITILVSAIAAICFPVEEEEL